MQNKNEIQGKSFFCRKCKRSIHNSLSIQRGFGPICYQRLFASKQIKLFKEYDMSELIELNEINKNDEQKEELKKETDRIKETFRCKWCGTDWDRSEIREIDGVYLCKICLEELGKKAPGLKK